MKNPEKQRIKQVDAAMILVPEKLLIFFLALNSLCLH